MILIIIFRINFLFLKWHTKTVINKTNTESIKKEKRNTLITINCKLISTAYDDFHCNFVVFTIILSFFTISLQ